MEDPELSANHASLFADLTSRHKANGFLLAVVF